MKWRGPTFQRRDLTVRIPTKLWMEMVESARIKRSLGHPSSSPRTSFNPPERSAPSVGHRGRHENGRGVFRVPSVCYYAALGQDWIHFVIHTHTLLSRGKKYIIYSIKNGKKNCSNGPPGERPFPVGVFGFDSRSSENCRCLPPRASSNASIPKLCFPPLPHWVHGSVREPPGGFSGNSRLFQKNVIWNQHLTWSPCNWRTETAAVTNRKKERKNNFGIAP